MTPELPEPVWPPSGHISDLGPHPNRPSCSRGISGSQHKQGVRGHLFILSTRGSVLTMVTRGSENQTQDGSAGQREWPCGPACHTPLGTPRCPGLRPCTRGVGRTSKCRKVGTGSAGPDLSLRREWGRERGGDPRMKRRRECVLRSRVYGAGGAALRSAASQSRDRARDRTRDGEKLGTHKRSSNPATLDPRSCAKCNFVILKNINNKTNH